MNLAHHEGEASATGSHQHGWAGAHDHAWRYFELHAGQRLTVFNFFIVIIGLLAAGIAASLQGSARFSSLGIVLGSLLTLLSFVFWKMDQRAAFLIKHAESILALTEAELLPPGVRLIGSEPTALDIARVRRSPVQRIWTFGTSFRLIFVGAALFGAASATLCGLRTAGLLEWNRSVAPAEAPRVKAVQREPISSLGAGAKH